MVLVDTSVWIDHLRRGNPQLAELLQRQQVCMHPMVIGELACGSLANRKSLLALWKNLPDLPEATHSEALLLLEAHSLMGRGIGYVDLHLLASTLLMPGTRLWTLDRRLANIAGALGIDFDSPNP